MARFIHIAATLIAGVALASFASPSGLALAASAQSVRPAAAKAKATGEKTVVTFAWGGGLADQMPSLPMFRQYGMHATYFVPSGLVCLLSQTECRKSSPYLTIRDIHEIAADGDEIGGLTVLHAQLTTLPAAEAKREICDDRSNLFRWGLRPTDFAYPFATVTPAVEALTRECGYNAGLGAGSLRGARRCNTCARAETIPPKNPLNVRAPIEVNSVHTTWSARTYESIVRGARQHGGGWVIFTIHDICPTNCNLGTTPSILGSVLKWLHGQARHHTVVETMRQVIGGPVLPPVAAPAPRTPPPAGVVNANLVQASGGHPACFQEADYGETAASFAYQPAGGPHGSATETIRVTKSGSGNAKLLQAMDLGLCAPSVTSGHAYTAGVWYKSSSPTQIEIYRRTLLGSWVYWTTSPVFQASDSWQQAAWTTPAAPPGTTALSFGLTTNSVGMIATTRYSLTIAKSHRALIFLAGLLVVIAGGALIARGHYRYVKYSKAEAANAEAANAGSTAAGS
jgi:peptidoglycan/xylan/chitin deacetylase (PgdA/CDA1 family)